MADQDQINRLKRGSNVWNSWREQHPEVLIDLSGAVLSRAALSGARLNGARLIRAVLNGAVLSGAALSGARLSGARLSGARLSGADLSGADLSGAEVGSTTFGNVNLSDVKGLETLTYFGPSTIGIDTIYLSQGRIPETFLREAGVPEVFREYMHALVTQPIQYETCFISYSSKDEGFAKQLRADLQGKGVRCWFAPHDLRPGTVIRRGIDEAIYAYDKLMLILSEQALASGWVAYEVETAIQKELEGKVQVLFPIRLDNAIMTCTDIWARHLRTRHIADFTKPDEYQQSVAHLLHHLKAPSNL